MGLHLYDTSMSNCSRLLKFSNGLLDAKICNDSHILVLKPRSKSTLKCERDRQFIFFLKSPSWLRLNSRNFDILLFNLLALKHFYRFRRQLKFVTAHSLNVLPLALILRLIFQFKVIYAPHELESRKAYHSQFRQKIRQLLEGNIINYCDQVILVNDSILDWYSIHYSLRVPTITVYNFAYIPEISFQKSSGKLRTDLGVKNQILLVTHGIISKGRGLEILVQVMRCLPEEEFHLVILGEGYLRSHLQSNSPSNVTFLDFVDYKEVVPLISQCDIGLNLIEGGVGKSYYLSSPNKLFESLAAGLFIISTDLPENRKFLLHDKRSILLSELSELELDRAIKLAAQAKRSEKNETTFRLEFIWKSQLNILIKAYENLLS